MLKLVHPLHVVLLAGTVPLFLGALVTDIAYFYTYEVQWKNFASWLLVGGLVLCGVTALWAVVILVRVRWLVPRIGGYVLVLLAIFVLGLVDAFVHAADAWASMPQALVISAVVAALAVVAIWLAIADPGVDRQPGGAR